MQKTIKIKLLPTKEQQKFINSTGKEYIKTINMLVDEMRKVEKLIAFSTKDFSAFLPSAVKNQCIREAKSIYNKQKKKVTKTIAILKKPVCIWNNQNFSIHSGTISFPVWNEKSTKISVRAIIPNELKEFFSQYKLGTLRISKKSKKYIAQITINFPEEESFGNGVMGIDLGLKIPAVCVTDTEKVCFVGNGRKNKYIKRKFRSKRKRLGKAKKLNAIRKSQNKEQRIMKDIDHKLSREIVNFAVANDVSTIKLEKLANIRKTARTSRKNEKNLHTWSFYRLAQYIEYKGKLQGISVEYVNPAYTSQICPFCGAKNKAKDRKYVCECGFYSHRDIVGAKNIINAPVVDGKSLPA